MQIVFVDLPGIHTKQPRAINRYMNRTALSSLADVGREPVRGRGAALDRRGRARARRAQAGRPADRAADQQGRPRAPEGAAAAVHRRDLTQKADFAEVVPLSATASATNLERLPEADRAATCRSRRASSRGPGHGHRRDRFMAAEIIREKLMLRLQEEAALRPRRRDRGHGRVRGRARQARGAGRDLGRAHRARRPS